MRPGLTCLICTLMAISVSAEEIQVLTWNVESDRPANEPVNHFADGNTPSTIATELGALQQAVGGYDLVGLTEVRANSASAYETAAETIGKNYRRVVSQNGGTDRLVILFDDERFQLVGDAVELQTHGGVDFPGGSARRPLFVRLRDHQNNDLEFIFMVNHLTRGNPNNRRRQAEGLREWADDQSAPIIATGDYNFDFSFETLTGNQAMAIFNRNDSGRIIWQWVVPNSIIETTAPGPDQRTMVVANFADTNWADDNASADPNQRVDRFPGSILDFVFVAKGAREWQSTSRVIVRPNDFPDSAATSDHRPVVATLDPEK